MVLVIHILMRDGVSLVEGRRRNQQFGDIHHESQLVVFIQFKRQAGTETQGGRDEVLLHAGVSVAHLGTQIAHVDTPSEVGIHVTEPFHGTFVVHTHIGSHGPTGGGSLRHALREVGIDETTGDSAREVIRQHPGVSNVDSPLIRFVGTLVIAVLIPKGDVTAAEITQGGTDGRFGVEFHGKSQISQMHVRNQSMQPRAVSQTKAHIVFQEGVLRWIVMHTIDIRFRRHTAVA